MFKDLRLENEPNDYAETYFFPQLTEKELELVEKKDPTYLKNFSYSNPDVNDFEMMNSKSIQNMRKDGDSEKHGNYRFSKVDDSSENS